MVQDIQTLDVLQKYNADICILIHFIFYLKSGYETKGLLPHKDVALLPFSFHLCLLSNVISKVMMPLSPARLKQQKPSLEDVCMMCWLIELLLCVWLRLTGVLQRCKQWRYGKRLCSLLRTN